VFKGHTSSLRAVCCNDKFVFSGSYDQSVKVWDIGTRKMFTEIKHFSNSVRSMLYLDPYLFCCDTKIYVGLKFH
jgi:WD40 repeat protein